MTTAEAAPATCELALVNDTDAAVNAYVTGREFGSDRFILLRADSSPDYREEPPGPASPLPVDASIPLGAPGSGPLILTLPRMYVARVYFVREDTLELLVVEGPGVAVVALLHRGGAAQQQ